MTAAVEAQSTFAIPIDKSISLCTDENGRHTAPAPVSLRETIQSYPGLTR